MPDAKPRPVRELETVWIPMSDGVRLAARIWLPEDADRSPVPALLEYIPYRRRDGTRLFDDLTHPWWAAQGYGCVRLDIRGSGDSEGLLEDEYTRQEHDDAVEAIAWLAAQPWCTGKVGMFGTSWGGFNALQVAARRPPALTAIIAVAFTDDRYADDMHVMGGALLNDNLNWGAQFFATMGQPPDPFVVGDAWRDLWRRRLAAVKPYFSTWLRHPARDAYWKHGSVCEDYAAVECAVLAIGGWADGYSNAAFRVLAGLSCPRRGIVGPWGHTYPHCGVPGPAIGFLQEGLRWWDHWLKGKDTGIMAEPMLRAWIQHDAPPSAWCDERPGHWAAEPAWPSPTVVPRRYLLGAGTLEAGDKVRKAELTVASPQTTGLASGEWSAFGLGGQTPELPLDQREDDGKSLVFDSAPLAASFEILGAPVVELELASDVPIANLIVRLNDVAPGGASLRVSYGVLNLTHRDGHARPKAMKPGRKVKVRVQMDDCGHAFAAGHRIRLAVSTAYWPMVVPPPAAVRLTLHLGKSALDLPVRAPRPEDAAVRFAPAVTAPPGPHTRLAPARKARDVTTDLATGLTIYTVTRDEGVVRLDATGVEVGFGKEARYVVAADDPLSARHEVDFDHSLSHPGWHTRIRARTAMSATHDHFVVEADLQAFDGGTRVFSRSWTERIPRKLV